MRVKIPGVEAGHVTEGIAVKAAEYWDANKEKVRDPTYWMALPLCRQAINRRISGSPHEWPIDWLKRVHVHRPLERGVSFGCGTGPFERSVRRVGLVREIDAFDVSPASLEEARRLALEEGLTGINYSLGSFDDPHLERGRYDIALFHASLHHVSNLERLFDELTLALTPGGAIYVDEFVGPSRDRWQPEDVQLAQGIFDLLPDAPKLTPTVPYPIAVEDPTEAIRSEEIVKYLPEYFDFIAWKPFGGQILGLILPWLEPDWVTSEEGQRTVRAMLAIEDDELRRDPSLTHHLVAFGRLKPRRTMRLRARGLSARAWTRAWSLGRRLPRPVRETIKKLAHIR